MHVSINESPKMERIIFGRGTAKVGQRVFIREITGILKI